MAGTLNGIFDNENLPAGYAWNVDYGVLTANTLTLEVLAMLGDMNGDNMISDADVNPFVEALTNRAAYDLHGYGVDTDLTGDVNGDGLFNLGDIGAFKLLVASAGAAAGVSASSVPEPSSLLLALLALTAGGFFFSGRRRS